MMMTAGETATSVGLVTIHRQSKSSNLERPKEKNVKEKLARINFFEILDKKQEKNPKKMGIKIQLNFQFDLKMTKLDLRQGEVLIIFRTPLLNNYCLSCV